MYKYLRYVGILLWTVFRKVFGLVWYYVAVPFRAYARNVVYNYVLQNKLYLKRLLERPITPIHRNEMFKPILLYVIEPYHGTEGGAIAFRRVSWLEYHLVYWTIWGWLDDDSNRDTFDQGYNRTVITGERLAFLPEFIRKSLARANEKYTFFGNSFDLGDVRAEYPSFDFWSSTLWNIRNTAYNFKYMQWEENRPEMLFYHRVGEYQFGYHPDGRLVFSTW